MKVLPKCIASKFPGQFACPCLQKLKFDHNQLQHERPKGWLICEGPSPRNLLCSYVFEVLPTSKTNPSSLKPLYWYAATARTTTLASAVLLMTLFRVCQCLFFAHCRPLSALLLRRLVIGHILCRLTALQGRQKILPCCHQFAGMLPNFAAIFCQASPTPNSLSITDCLL